MNLSLEKIKVNKRQSEETECFSANILLDGKFVAEVSNSGKGESDKVVWHDQDAKEKVDKMIAAQPKIEACRDFWIDTTLEIVVGKLLDQYLQELELREWCKKKTVFRLKGDMPGSWRTVAMVFDEKAENLLRTKHSYEIEEILNLRFK